MEEVEIHSKSYLVRWVNAKPEHTIAWTVQPHKRSINFGIFKHPGISASLPISQIAPILPPPPSPSATLVEDEKNEVASIALEKLTSIGLKQVHWVGKCEADKISQGKYELPTGEAGNYALVFDNSFSKNISKTVTFFLLTYPSSCQSQISFGATLYHSQAMASALSMAPPPTSRKSPKLKARGKESVDSLRKASASHSMLSGLPSTSEAQLSVPDPSSIHTGVLQKRRRKKHQGYARRFFCVDFTSSTLSYYHDRNSSALRGAIPLSLAAIGANAKSREISIDSGAEIWHLKAANQADFAEWKAALETASRLAAEATNPADTTKTPSKIQMPGDASVQNDQEWARLETLLSRVSGTRDAVRRLCLETLAQPIPSPSPRSASGPSTPIESGNDDYFRDNDKRPFWKRKASSPGTAANNIFKRSVSSQLSAPSPGTDSSFRNGAPNSTTSLSMTLRPPHGYHESGMQDHCKALLYDLDSLVSQFSTVINEGKIRRSTAPMSAVSRLSIQSIESQEYFDAEDNSRLLNIHSDSDRDEATDTDALAIDEDSVTSSDIGDDSVYFASKRSVRSGSVSSLFPPKSKSLSPLPMTSISRRTTIKPPTIMPPSLIGFLRKNVGKDLSTISMPVSANEPLSLLQRAAEQLEYSELLDQAAETDDAAHRLIFVTAFAISTLSNARVKERSIRKPFNPMLGETFELVREDKGFRFISEKVSHRPVQLAFHAESLEWSITQSPLPSQKFWGKSSEIITEGKVRLLLHSRGESYSWSSATCFLRNIIAGEKYVEPVGTLTVLNESTGESSTASFRSKGMFSGRSEDVEVDMGDARGISSTLGIQGTWTQSLRIREPGSLSKTTIWETGPLVENAAKHYGMTTFAATLNEITTVEQGKLPPTDSRLRSDQRALESGDHEKAEKYKNQLEEAQRARRREMETTGESWKPRWFSQVNHGDEVMWKLKTGKEGYWEERIRGDWTGVVPVLDI